MTKDATIKIDPETRASLKCVGSMGETYDDVINRLLDAWHEHVFNPMMDEFEEIINKFAKQNGITVDEAIKQLNDHLESIGAAEEQEAKDKSNDPVRI
jgi:hypothetical protein